MMTKITDLTNGYFCVRQNDKKDVLIASLINAVIPADAWNDLRDKVCNDTKISDDTTVYFDYLIINGEVDRFCYVSVGDWRKLGFSGNNIKNCIPSAPKEVIEEADKFFYYNGEILRHGTLCGTKLEHAEQMILKAHYIAEFKAMARDARDTMRKAGMSDEEITGWFERIIHDAYHPKC